MSPDELTNRAQLHILVKKYILNTLKTNTFQYQGTFEKHTHVNCTYSLGVSS